MRAPGGARIGSLEDGVRARGRAGATPQPAGNRQRYGGSDDFTWNRLLARTDVTEKGLKQGNPVADGWA